MGRRVQLHQLLKTTINSENVYFQPPPNLQLKFPCVIYKRALGDTKFADNKPYNHQVGYLLQVVDADPDSLLPEKIAELPKCVFERHYTTNNMNYTLYNIYY